MSGPQKFPNSPFPIRPPFPLPNANSDKINNLQQNIRNNIMMASIQSMSHPQPNNIPSNLFYSPRFFNPYMNGYGMFPTQPFAPYSPFGRQSINQNNSQN